MCRKMVLKAGSHFLNSVYKCPPELVIRFGPNLFLTHFKPSADQRDEFTAVYTL